MLEHRRSGRTREAEADERLLSSAQLLGPFRTACAWAFGARSVSCSAFCCGGRSRARRFLADEGVLLESLAVQSAW